MLAAMLFKIFYLSVYYYPKYIKIKIHRIIILPDVLYELEPHLSSEVNKTDKGLNSRVLRRIFRPKWIKREEGEINCVIRISVFVLFNRYFSTIKLKSVIGGACKMHRMYEKFLQNFVLKS
jgi:hypothetical protein